MKAFKLVVSSPSGNSFEGDVVKLDVRGVEGELAVMAGHIPFITSLVKSPCTLHFEDGSIKTAECDGGILTVAQDKTTLLSGSFKFTE